MKLTQHLGSIYSKFQTQFRQHIITQGEKLIRSLDHLIVRNSLIGDHPFFDPAQFPWIENLEQNWLLIRKELDAILENVNELPNFQDISPDQYDITQDHRWKTYFLYAYGYKAEKNCSRCPETTRLVEQVPGMKTAFFSILLPHKHIPEHDGPYKGVVRYHLALKVPQSQTGCRIRVGNHVRSWEEGKSLIFDDTYLHEVWNETNEIRAVLFLDFVRPIRFPISLLNQLMIQLIAWSPFVQTGKANAVLWENRFEAACAMRNQE